ncbi:acetyl/propionyl/methylcrotonyl-CoA carboxylase subunit alpha [Tropicibacter naphthalenivorans]|uniref:biotin carboxylase n=1 Tax=Tropicibacter naphthalenivorans TaxID=441103 RepID=A0A0P1GGB0_9RHOB|nr:acetyl-CoA carboxylase biotin carboxylase subunit [Tropicibacter naphthalenivorans]CUH80616.1 Biotin carboxylase [Tropicibacter naphthalenivorans]SMC89059.1 acetyl-CoA carboxylase, biotin carboxylase subunit [Tropicibacter naphthalenivorans]
MAKIKRIFIANRGEIAVRIIRTCRELGIETVLGVSEANRDTLGAQLATRVVCLGPAAATQSYLKVGTVIEAAMGTGCDAIHPGYGFLSENKDLAEACAETDLIFIGPSPDNLTAVGDKLTARTHDEKAGVPLTPGGSVDTEAEALKLAEAVGFPLLIKAVSGGGGRGMKRVNSAAELPAQLNLAISEAAAAFGDGRVYLERFVTVGRHVEVQILSDGETVLHTGERDCSVQRRYQKVVEEAPAPGLPDTLRQGLLDAAVTYARHISYRSLGTVEFLVDVERQEFYFLEMNARIQVEHPVTEAITGLDLIALQIAIAEGKPLGMRQNDITLHGHAIECRLNAEDIQSDFMPSPGRIKQAWFPSLTGVRVDTHMQPGAMISPFYDSMIAKLITWGPTRADAIARMQAVLNLHTLDGVTTNAPLHSAIMADETFQQGGVDTTYLTGVLPRLTEDKT